MNWPELIGAGIALLGAAMAGSKVERIKAERKAKREALKAVK